MKAVSIAVVALVALVVVGVQFETTVARTDHISLFVAIKKDESRQLIERLVSFAESNGLKSRVGTATDDQGMVRTVVEAIGGNSRIWMSNVLLSGEEPAPCLSHVEGYPDPQQFEIRARTRFSLLPSDRPEQLLRGLEDLFRKNGIVVGKIPWLCGASAFASAKQ